jgi:hypothetical protein
MYRFFFIEQKPVMAETKAVIRLTAAAETARLAAGSSHFSVKARTRKDNTGTCSCPDRWTDIRQKIFLWNLCVSHWKQSEGF